ncbi:unnamed protein product [Fraxinus pennsylvanica]|uniref:Uncharacterized protein n=1 Tax=Fraxinus pennsylvanica TaxID=56036 RepID=A0AAD1ZE50_9LAMI|nr:unnamed protein product [Fraxinus pennsylvanica]
MNLNSEKIAFFQVYFTIYGHLKELLHLHEISALNISSNSGNFSCVSSCEHTEDGNDQLSFGSNMISASGAGLQQPLQQIHCGLLRHNFNGLLPSLAGISHVAIQLPAYEKNEILLSRTGGGRFITPAFEPVVMSELCIHQIVRSKLQEQGQMMNSGLQYDGVLDCIKKVFEKEGLTGFYRGCALLKQRG